MGGVISVLRIFSKRALQRTLVMSEKAAAIKAESPSVNKSSNVKRAGRLYAKATFTGFKRGLRNQHENTALLRLEECLTMEEARWYIGKKAVFVYKAKNKTSVPLRPGRKTRMRAIWGKVTRTHGSRGGLRAKFKNTLPASAMGRRIRIMLYPSTI